MTYYMVSFEHISICPSLIAHQSRHNLPWIIILIFSIRYKYENNRVMDTSSDVSSPLQYHLYGNGKIGVDVPSRGTQNQLLERQVFFIPLYLASNTLFS